MVRSVLFAIAVLRAAASFGQITYGNEWIDHDKQYWRFDVYADGAYRIDSAALATAGFPLGSMELNDLMLFGREKQVPIYIHGGEDGVLNGADYIEFIGRKNDGWIDTRMFASPQEHANPWYSLCNDTIHYFLTWDSDPNVLKERVLPYVNPDLASYTAKPWVWGLANTIMSNFYWHGLDDGEYGYTSGLMVAGEGYGGLGLLTDAADVENTRLTLTPRAYIGSDAPLAKAHITVAALSSASTGVFNHHLQIQRGAGFAITELDTIFTGSLVLRKSFQLPSTDLVNDLDLRFRVPHDLAGQVGLPADYRDYQAPVNIRVNYPRDLGSIAVGPLDFWVPNETGELVARLALPTFTGNPVIYADGDTTRRIEPTLSGSTWDALLPLDLDSATTHSFLFTTQTVRVISGLSLVNGNGYFVDYSAMDPDSAVMIVAHRSLWNGATAYASYRATSALQPRPTILADIDELYDQFGGGVPKNAQAIRGWCKFALDTWTTQPQGLFLIGKSVITNYGGGNYGDGFRNPVGANNGAYERCLVPTFGWPPCDQCFTIGLNFDARRMDIPVGRLSAFTEQQVFDYLDKVNEFEHQPVDAWMKNVSHLSGGFNGPQQDLLALSLRTLEPFADDNTSFGAQYWRFRKNSSNTFSTASADSVRTLIQGGVTILNFLAHGYGAGFDITVDDPANYDWNGKYPLVIGNSCYTGNIHINVSLFSQSEDWTMRPNSGPIAFLAQVNEGLSYLLTQYDQYFYQSFASVNYGKTIGQHMKYTGSQFLNFSNNIRTVGTIHGFTLEGDPMLVLNSPPDPDFVVRDQDLLFAPENVNADVDSFDVKLLVRN
ncbi:MAG TPA: C25 family cysteine peptidase, partial [Flavobacteriales bacterium]|nr:C25 family cysteine peptidase [Flavobacteriales bacterium]